MLFLLCGASILHHTGGLHKLWDGLIYPDNLAAKATLWLWELKDLAIIGIGFLIGIFSLVRTGALLPLALVVAYGFLSIRFDNTSILDFIRYAAAYFFTRQQYFEWRDPT